VQHLVHHDFCWLRLSADYVLFFYSVAPIHHGGDGENKIVEFRTFFSLFHVLAGISGFSTLARFLAIFLHFGAPGTAAQYRRRSCSTGDGASRDGNGRTTQAKRWLYRIPSPAAYQASWQDRENRTFDRQQAASAWLEKREKELARPGALERLEAPDPTLTIVIDRYTDESIKKIGRTKAQVRRTIKNYDIVNKRCSEITSTDVMAFANELIINVTPQTVGNYLSHLAAVFAVAKPAWAISS